MVTLFVQTDQTKLTAEIQEIILINSLNNKLSWKAKIWNDFSAQSWKMKHFISLTTAFDVIIWKILKGIWRTDLINAYTRFRSKLELEHFHDLMQIAVLNSIEKQIHKNKKS